MSTGRAILKYNGNYYHSYLGDSFDVHAVAPGEFSSGYYKDKGGAYLSLYDPMNAYQGKVHTGKLKAIQVNGATLWDAGAGEKDIAAEQRGEEAKPSVLEQLRLWPSPSGGRPRRNRKKGPAERE